MSLKKKIVFLSILAYLLTLLILYFFILDYYKKNFIKTREETGKAILKIYYDNLIYATILENKNMIKSYVNTLMKTNFIDYLTIKKNNQIIFTNKKNINTSIIEIIISKVVNVLKTPVNIAIILGLNINDFNTNFKKVIKFLILFFLVICIFFSILIYFIIIKSFKPLEIINDRIIKLQSDKYEKIENGNFYEFTPIVKTFNELVERLKEKDEKIKEQLKEISSKNKELEEKLAEIVTLQEMIITREKLASLGTIVAGVAHEINNPVSAIRGLCELETLKNKDNKRLTKIFNKIIFYCDRISSIVKTLKVYGKPTKEEIEEIELSEIINDAIEMEQHSKILGNINIKGNYKHKKGKIYAKKDEILQIFINLLNNSAEVLNEKGDIIIDIEEDDENIYVHYRDTGPGIPDNIKNRIFEPFFTTKDKNGTGLGMYIVYKIMGKYNGTITIVSSNNGAYFLLKFKKGDKS